MTTIDPYDLDEDFFPVHLLISVDEMGHGPVPDRDAKRKVCWCSDTVRCMVLRPVSLEDGIMDVQLEHSTEVLLNVHSLVECAGRACPIHNRTDHPMRSFPQHWRSDRGLMERVCPHGIGHPDPDGYVYLVRRYGERGAATRFVHGCDGCGHGPDDDVIFDALTEDD